MNKNIKRILFFAILGSLGLGWGVAKFAAAQTYQGVVNTVTAAIEAAVQVKERAYDGLMMYEERVEFVVVNDQQTWGAGLVALFDPETGEPVPSEPALAVARLTEEGWVVWLPGDDHWPDLVREAPAEIFPGGEKGIYLEYARQAEVVIPAGPLHGYYLPWAGGKSVNLTNSVCHDTYLTSGDGHFSFDFAVPAGSFNDPSRFFPIMAAKGGTVQLWKDDVPTCYDYSCASTQILGNYIVIKDSTTTPTTYMLYLHLEQGSIPAELKVKGKPVARGQFLGRVDNTGQSYGHHLHFQVQVATYGDPNDFLGYWGKSVDITFKDVFINGDSNGGRPRAPYDLTGDTQDKVGLPGPTCCGPTDRCETVQSSYISGNYTETTPPTGGITAPAMGARVSQTTATLQGWAADTESPIGGSTFYARLNNTWQAISPPVPGNLSEYAWDMCVQNVPDGPVTIGVVVEDAAGNKTPLTGFTTFIKQASCPPPPPACVPTANQAALFTQVNYGGSDCLLLNVSGLFPVGREAVSGLYDLRTALAGKPVQSVKVGANVRLTLFLGIPLAFDGRPQTFTTDNANLADDYFSLGAGVAVAQFAQVAALSALPPLPPYQTWPPNGAEIPAKESITLVWDQDGDSTLFDMKLFAPGNLAVPLVQGETDDPYWHLDTLNTLGVYTWTVRAKNSAGETAYATPGFTFTLTNSVPGVLSAQAVPYLETFEGPTDNWNVSGLWHKDDTQPYAGTHAMRYASQGSGTYATLDQPNAGSLTLPPVTLSQSNLFLQFQYRFETGYENQHYDQRWVQISENGGPFKNVLRLRHDTEGQWVASKPFSLAVYNGKTIQVRFYFTTIDGINNANPGWWVDNVSIAPYVLPSCGVVDQGDTVADAQLVAFETTTTAKICGQGDADYYKFSGLAGQRVEINVDAQTIGSPLDAVAFLYDIDGSSVVAYSADENPLSLVDPLIVYTIPKTGTYYFKIIASDHPDSGGFMDNYTVLLSRATPVVQTVSLDGSLAAPTFIPNATPGQITLSLSAWDTATPIKKAVFKWHSANWESDNWQLIGEDTDGSDGWSVLWNYASLGNQTGIALLYQVEDMAGNVDSRIAWNLTLDQTPPTTLMTALPAQLASTALQLKWSTSDNDANGLAGFNIQVSQNGGAFSDYQVGLPSSARSAWFVGEQGKTYAFRVRGYDQAGNLESATPANTTTTAIQTCTVPDAFEPDDTFEQGTLLENGQVRNLCLPGDQDWVTFTLPVTGTVYFVATPLDATTAVTISVYQAQPITATNPASLLFLQEAGPSNPTAQPVQALFGKGTVIRYTISEPQVIFVRIQHIDPSVAGNAVAYRFALAYPGLFLPILAR